MIDLAGGLDLEHHRFYALARPVTWENRPALETQGEWDEVSELVRTTLDRDNSAKRQLWAFAQSGQLEGVVDLIIRESELGL
jgi:carboxylate-amine ligase